jgi:type I restriction enzyme S subunit
MLRAFHLERFAQGAGVPTLNRNLVHSELVEVPSIAEQKNIIEIFDKVEVLRQMHMLAANQLSDLSGALSMKYFD